jgi:hypothetical protein
LNEVASCNKEILMKNKVKLIIAGALAGLALSAASEPTSGALNITQLRPYSGGNTVFLYTNGNFCPQAFYSIDLSSSAGKAMYAAALAALVTGKYVHLEIANTCGTGVSGSTALQSIYIFP